MKSKEVKTKIYSHAHFLILSLHISLCLRFRLVPQFCDGHVAMAKQPGLTQMNHTASSPLQVPLHQTGARAAVALRVSSAHSDVLDLRRITKV